MTARLGIVGLAAVVALTGCSRSSDRHPGQPPVPPAVPVAAGQPAPVLSAVAPDDPTIAAVRAMLDEPARSNVYRRGDVSML